MPSSLIANEQIESRALKGNALGDPATRRLPVYLPPGYDAGSERYPVCYLLAGYTGSGAMMLNEAAWEENIQQRMDRLIAEHKARPMILVLPDCFTRYGGSQYINSSAVGNYADYLREIVEFTDRRFRTIADREHRAILGKSSGGYGALVNAMQHPEIWGLCCDHSGDKYFELCYKPDFPKFLKAAAKYKDVAKVLANPAAIRPRDHDFFNLVMIAAMAACYSPNPHAELGFDLPLDPYTGRLNEAVWARWLEWDPVFMVDRYAQALRSLRLLYMDCGNRDEFHLQYGCRIFGNLCKEKDIPIHYEEFNDGHRGISYRYDESLKEVSETLG